MAKVIGPWTPNYPVDFNSNGDTTRAAFGKHIQEIERIYGLLSGLGASKIEAEDLTAAMTANRNEWATAIAAEKSARESAIAAEATARSNEDIALGRRIDGLTFGDIGGTLGLDRTTGNLPSSRIVGNLDASRINGLMELIRNSVGGVNDATIDDNGYIKFGNGLIIQWGEWAFSTDENMERITKKIFYTSFPNKCFSVTLSPKLKMKNESETIDYDRADIGFAAIDWTNSRCRVLPLHFTGSGYLDNIEEIHVTYIAFGR